MMKMNASRPISWLICTLPLLFVLSVAIPRCHAAEEIDLKNIAQAATDGDVGVVSRQSPLSGGPGVIIFEETHISRVGQVEIALMLVRCYRHGIRDIALEGFSKGRKVNETWLRSLPLNFGERRRVATQLLEEGEITAPEYLTLLSEKIQVHPIEDAAEYAVEMGKVDSAAPVIYLFRIALKSLIDREDITALQKIQELQEKEDFKELIDFVIDADKWTSNTRKTLDQDKTITSVEELHRLVEVIEKKAADSGVPLESEDREAMKGLKAFLDAARKRSATMVTAVQKIAQEAKTGSAVMIMGAAHTDGACKLLDARGVKYVVITPMSLKNHSEKGDLSLAAFERLGRGLSVDEDTLGAFLDGRRKPPYQPGATHKKTKGEIYALTHRIASAFASSGGSGQPPYGLDYKKDLAIGATRVVAGSIQKVDDDVVFQVEVIGDQPDKKVILWVRANRVGKPTLSPTAEREANEKIDSLLLAARERLLRQDRQKEPERPTDRSDEASSKKSDVTPTIQVSPQVIAIYSQSKEKVMRTPL